MLQVFSLHSLIKKNRVKLKRIYLEFKILFMNIFIGRKSSKKLFDSRILSFCDSGTLRLWDFNKILSSTFFHQLILINIYMNANIMKTQFFTFVNNDLRDC